MLAQTLIQNLTQQVEEHEALLLLATEKTEIVKAGNVEALEKTMKQEQRHIFIVQKLEKERIEIVYRFMSGRSFQGVAPTLSDCMEVVEGQEKTELLVLMSKLVEIVRQLKQANEWNKELLSQSLQFVNVTLSMIQPLEQDPAYKKDHGKKEVKGHSLFNVQT